MSLEINAEDSHIEDKQSHTKIFIDIFSLNNMSPKKGNNFVRFIQKFLINYCHLELHLTYFSFGISAKHVITASIKRRYNIWLVRIV